MIIHSSKALKPKRVIEPKDIKEENVEKVIQKPIEKKTKSSKKNNKKSAPVVQEVVVEEVKNEEDIDLSEWLKDDIEE